jgi:hypothetical protein
MSFRKHNTHIPLRLRQLFLTACTRVHHSIEDTVAEVVHMMEVEMWEPAPANLTPISTPHIRTNSVPHFALRLCLHPCRPPFHR